jgi:MoaA/NifB/PqqE/SkfB family radical SAM enzyme
MISRMQSQDCGWNSYMFNNTIQNNTASYDPLTNQYSVSKIDKRFSISGPLTVGFQVTRRCNLKCIYCSESISMPDPSIEDIKRAFLNLKDAGVLKINITGGEALLRIDIRDILELSNALGFATAIDTNAVLMTDELADFLVGKLAYLESTIDGRKETHNKVRGNYDKVIAGIKKVIARNIPVYIAMVLLGDCIDDAKDVLSTADALGVRHVKFLTPIPKARGKSLPIEYLENTNLKKIWESLCEYKEKNSLKPSISLSDWKMTGDGSVIIVNANGTVVGCPTYSEDECMTKMGNIYDESVKDMWSRYKYKDNHIRKYLGETINMMD